MKSHFRTNWIRRLRAEGQKLAIASSLTDIEKINEVFAARKAYENVNDQLRGIGANELPKLLELPPILTIPLVLGRQDEKEIRESLKDSGAMDRAGWKFIALTKTFVVSHVYGEPVCKNRRWRTVRHADHTIGYQSFGVILASGKEWQTMKLGEAFKHKVPEGYTLEKDTLGLRLVRDSDGRDFHPSYIDQHSGNPNSWAAEIERLDAIRTAAEERKKEKEKHRQLFYADAKTTRVHMQDSRAVGNCVAGTIAFGERLGVTLGEYHGINTPGVSGALLLRTRDPRAEAAVWAAWERETLVCI